MRLKHQWLFPHWSSSELSSHMLWFESVCQWLTDYCLAILTVPGSIKPQSCPITELGQTPPLLSTAWTGNQLQMQTLEEGECFRCSAANQNQACLAACLHNEPFSGPKGRGRSWYWRMGVLRGARTKLAIGCSCNSCRHTKDRLNNNHFRQVIISMATKKTNEKKLFAFLWASFICKCVISSNL